jgi:hypothetical protein
VVTEALLKTLPLQEAKPSLWHGLEDSQVPITPAQREELDRRLSDGGGRDGPTWGALQAKLRQRLA